MLCLSAVTASSAEVCSGDPWAQPAEPEPQSHGPAVLTSRSTVSTQRIINQYSPRFLDRFPGLGGIGHHLAVWFHPAAHTTSFHKLESRSNPFLKELPSVQVSAARRCRESISVTFPQTPWQFHLFYPLSPLSSSPLTSCPSFSLKVRKTTSGVSCLCKRPIQSEAGRYRHSGGTPTVGVESPSALQFFPHVRNCAPALLMAAKASAEIPKSNIMP